MSTTDNTTAPDGFDIRNHIAAAWGHGLAVLPVQHDGTKKPRGKWKHLQHERLSLDETHKLFRSDDTGYGIICGEVSGNLEMLEIEAAAIKGGLMRKIRERLEKAGLLEEFLKILYGCCVQTPSGGLHFVYYVDGEVLGNTKLAMRPATPEERQRGERAVTLIETRGEGGFFMAPWSHGEIHVSGKLWKQREGGLSTIVTISAEVRDAIFDVLRSFDEMPAAEHNVVPLEQPWTLGPSWDDDETPAGWFRRHHPSIDDMLEEDGWTTLNGTSWTRPGKSQREGTSAELHVADDGAEFLNIFSTSVPPEYERAGRPGRPGSPVVVSCSPIQVLAAVRFGGDVAAASSWIRRELMPKLQPSRTLGLSGSAAEPGGIDRQADDGDSSPPSLGMAPSFWDETPWLQAVRDRARARLLSPDAVLGALEARYAAAIPPTLKIPPIVGATATFDHMSVIVGRSSAGKSAADHVAKELFGEVFDKTILWSVPIGSGEGLVQGFLGDVSVEDEDGNKRKERQVIYDATHFLVDEMTGFIESAKGRSGTTIAQTMCMAWSGTGLGQANSSAETRRIIAAGRVRISGLMACQTANGYKMLDDHFVDMGLAGRLSFFWGEDPNMPDLDSLPDDSFEPLDLPIPNKITTGSLVDVHPDIALQIRQHRHAVVTGRRSEAPIDGHDMLVRLKRACIYSLMSGEQQVSLRSWELAGIVGAASRRIRAHMLSHRAERMSAEDVSRGRAAARRELAKEAVIEGAVLSRTKANILRHLSAAPDKRLAQGRLRKKLSAQQGELIEVALDELENEGHVERLEGKSYGSKGVVIQFLS